MKSIYTIFILIFCCASSHAQNDKKPAPQAKCDLSVVYFGDPGKNHQLYYRKGQGQTFHAIKSRSSSVAPPQKYMGPALLTFYTKDSSVELGYTPIGTCQLNNKLRRAIVIAYSTKKSKPIFQAIDSSLEQFPLGSRIVVNRTTAQLRGLYTTLPDLETKRVSKKEVFKIKPKGHTLVLALEPDAAPMKSHYSQIEYMKIKEGAAWQTLRKSRWFHTPDQRHIIFVYYENGLVRMRSVSDATIRTAKSKPFVVNLAQKEKNLKKNAALEKTNKEQDEFYKKQREEIEKAKKKALQDKLKPEAQ